VQPARVQGVDLNLDEFNLSEATQVGRQAGLKVAAGVDITDSFWSNLDTASKSMFSAEDQALLRAVFNPRLSDRRDEGDRFVPPDTSFAYIQGLRTLLQEEESVRQQRERNFCSSSFDMETPGLLYPSSWQSSVEISRQETASKHANSVRYARPDYKSQAHLLEDALKKSVPVFDKCAEDGSRFRVYKLGSLEVRTIQHPEGKESVGAVFSVCSPAEAFSGHRSVAGSERVVKVTEYVERCGADRHHCYAVLETEKGNGIVAEELESGAAKWEHNPRNLECRNSAAKVLRTFDCSGGITVEGAAKHHPSKVILLLSGSKC